MNIDEHEAYLREKIFFTETRWPQYNLLLNDIKKLAALMVDDSYILSIERNKLYGGYSLFAPFFTRQLFVAQDNTPYENARRGAYNDIDDPRRIRKPTTTVIRRKPDLIMVPNLVHHIANQKGFFERLARELDSGGYLYIFEPAIREIHQAPNDYVRYTPEGLAYIVRNHGFEVLQEVEIGGPFTALFYLYDQVKQYIPEAAQDKLRAMSLIDCLQLDGQYHQNLVRPHTRICTAFSLLARRL